MRPPFNTFHGLLGNHVPHIGPTSGAGRPAIKTPFSRLTIYGKAQDVQYVSVSDLYSSSTASGITLFAQVWDGTVTLDFTLAPPDLAVNKEYDGSGIWQNTMPVGPADGIKQIPIMCTAIRVTFNVDATLFLIGA